MSTNSELVQRAEAFAQQVAQNKTEIEAMVRKLDEVQAPSIALSKEDIRQAIIEKGQEVDTSVPFSEYGNKIRKIEVSENIPESIPSITDNIVTIPVGKISENKEITVGTAKEAKTYTPSTKNQTISKDTYLKGVQTIKGDANLIAQNIKSGVSLFDVAGTFTSDATATASDIAKDKTAYVNGEKVVGTATGSGGSSSGTILYMPMNGNLDIYGDLKTTSCICEEYNAMDMYTGDWSPTFSDDGVFEGEKCFFMEKTVMSEDDWYPPSNKMVWLPTNGNFIKNDFTIDVWIHKPSEGASAIGLSRSFSIKLEYGSAGKARVFFFNEYKFNNQYWHHDYFDVDANDTWNHIAWVKEGSSLYYFFNGVLLKKYDNVNVGDISSNLQPYKNRRGSIGSLEEQTEIKTAHLRILNHALWAENFTPPTKESYSAYMV